MAGAEQQQRQCEREPRAHRRPLSTHFTHGTTHSSDIQNLETKLSTVYRRNHLAETRLNAAETSARARQMLYGEHVRDALDRFEMLEQQVDEAEGRADSLALGAPPSADDARIDAELAALRPGGGFGRKRVA